MKVLSKIFFLSFLLGGLYSQAMGAAGLVEEIEGDFKVFRGYRVPNVAQQPCKAVQYICYLQENAAKIENAAAKIALIIGSGTGVGGISKREATSLERALMVKGINFALRENLQEDGFNLELKDFPDHIGQHQKVVALMVKGSQAVFAAPLNNIGKNPCYEGVFPQVPVFHPYNADANYHGGMVPVATRLDTSAARALLPADLQRRIQGIPDDQVDTLFVAQQKIPGEKDDTLFRPHPWVSWDGSPWGADVWAYFSPASYGETIIQSYETTQNVSVHDGVFSPEDFSIEHLLPKPSRSLAFWSLCQANGRYALALHWILEADDPAYLLRIVEDLPKKTMGGLVKAIEDYHKNRFAMEISERFHLSELYHFAF